MNQEQTRMTKKKYGFELRQDCNRCFSQKMSDR